MDGTLTNLGKRYWEPFFRAIDKLKPDHDREKRQEVFEKTLMTVVENSFGSSRIIKIKAFLKAFKDSDLSLIDVYRGMKLVRKDPLAFREVEPLDGVEEILSLLHSRGYKLALVTNASDDTLKIAKKELKALKKFDAIVTRNMVKRMKPYPEAVLKAINKLKKDPKSCVMIGDFPQDIKAGKAAGIKTIAILGDNGKYTENIIKKLNPDIILKSIHELEDIFPNLI
jgi:HAD superfamily hydrolase (TIGR01509 family)